MRAASTTRAPARAAFCAVTSPMPLDAPVITMTCSRDGLERRFHGRTWSVTLHHRLHHRVQPVADARGQRLGRRLPDDAQRALLVQHLEFGPAFVGAPAAQRHGRLADAQPADDDLRQPRWQRRIDHSSS